jgi:hypothetical protein
VLEVRASSWGPGPRPEGGDAISQRVPSPRGQVEVAVQEARASSRGPESRPNVGHCVKGRVVAPKVETLF